MTLLLALLAGLALQPPEPPGVVIEELVVTARRPNAMSLGDPADHFRRHCFDPQRRTGRFIKPGADDPHWHPLDGEVRERLGVTDPQIALFGLTDHVLRHSFVLRIERVPQPGGLTQHRCTLTVIGGIAHDRLQAGMAVLFRGPGTQRHLGHPAGERRLLDWRQHVWTAMPQRGSDAWRDAAAAARRPGGTFIVVTDPSFYDDHSYVLGDLKTRTGRQPTVSILTLAHTLRERSR